MPCKDYESDYHDDVEELKEQCDRLARIACKAMQELEDNGIEDMLVLKDDEVRDWWLKHKEADRKAREKREKAERRAQVKAEALSKLSSEEREVLGIDANGDPLEESEEYVFDLETETDIAGYRKVLEKEYVKVYMDRRGDLHVNDWVREDEDDFGLR